MSPRNLAEVLLKVWAVTLLVEAVLGVPNIAGQIMAMGGEGDTRAVRIMGVWSFLYFALTAIVGSWILKFAPRVAARLAPPPSDEQFVAPRLEVAAFGVLGAYFLILGLRDCASLAFRAATKPFGAEMPPHLWQGYGEEVTGAIVMTIGGLLLLLGREGLATSWRRLRGDGMRSSA